MSLQFKLIPNYQEIFQDEAPDLNELLDEIPFLVIIEMAAIISSELYMTKNENESQRKIWNILSFRFPSTEKERIEYQFFKFKKKTNIEHLEIFTEYYLLELIQYALLNYKDHHIEDTRPIDELNIFKSYLIIVEQTQSRDTLAYEKNRKPVSEKDGDLEDFFQKSTWAMLIKQMSVSYKINVRYEFIKSLLFFQYLEKDFKDYLTKYLEYLNIATTWEVVAIYLSLINSGFDQKITLNQEQISSPVFFDLPESHKKILDSIAIDTDFTKSIDLNKNIDLNDKVTYDFLMIRDKPIFKAPNGFYFVLSWQFFQEKLSKSLIFDFYNISGINEKIKTFRDFLNEKAFNFTEKEFFKSLISNIFKGKYDVVKFDDSIPEKDGDPDCYVRIGKYIFLFELKDNLMPSKAIEGQSYDELTKDYKKKLVRNEKGKAEGIGQLLKTIESLNQKCYDFDLFEKKGLKRKNMVVFPIIVYTDRNYSLPGLQNFLRQKFNTRKNKNHNFSKLEETIMIDLETFFDLIHSKLSHNFKDYCTNYNKKIKDSDKDFLRNKSMENFHKRFDSFEQYMTKNFNFSKQITPFEQMYSLFNIELPKE